MQHCLQWRRARGPTTLWGHTWTTVTASWRVSWQVDALCDDGLLFWHVWQDLVLDEGVLIWQVFLSLDFVPDERVLFWQVSLPLDLVPDDEGVLFW